MDTTFSHTFDGKRTASEEQYHPSSTSKWNYWIGLLLFLPSVSFTPFSICLIFHPAGILVALTGFWVLNGYYRSMNHETWYRWRAISYGVSAGFNLLLAFAHYWFATETPEDWGGAGEAFAVYCGVISAISTGMLTANLKELHRQRDTEKL